MVRKLKETKASLERDRKDLKQILKYGTISISHRIYLERQLREVEKKLEEYERVSD